MSEPKNKSRILILSHMAQFSLLRRHEGQIYSGLSDMAFHSGAVEPGDLVALQSAPASKWYLGWLVEKKWPEGYACEVYTIESIEDGQLCEWSNVSLVYYDRSQVRSHPEWRWTDAQHEFKDRWLRACRKLSDAFLYPPLYPVFIGNAVRLGIGVRYSVNSSEVGRWFSTWRKTKIKEMLDFYNAAVAELKAKRPAKDET